MSKQELENIIYVRAKDSVRLKKPYGEISHFNLDDTASVTFYDDKPHDSFDLDLKFDEIIPISNEEYEKQFPEFSSFKQYLRDNE